MIGISRPNEGEVILIWNGEEYAAVGVLTEICLRRVEHLADHDVRSSYQADRAT